MKGFTLIEILIALAVFAILSAMTALSMSHAFNTRERVSQQIDRLSEIDFSITRMNRDANQITARPVRDEQMRLKPAFIGQDNYMEFTRSGLTNPNAFEKRATLKRIAFLCNKNELVRRSFARLDSASAHAYEDKVLISHLKSCAFTYLTPQNQWSDQWLNITNTRQNTPQSLPKAVQISLRLADLGKLSLVFVIPEGLYVFKRKTE